MRERDEIIEGSKTAFLNATYNSNVAYKPQFISNDYTNGVKVLSTIDDELRNCDEFIISVAFITQGGIVPLLQTLQELEAKSVPGKILTTDYNTFTDPLALDKLAEFHNIELRMYHEVSETEDFSKPDTEKIGFHTKGYLFKKGEVFSVIIGSSNMTAKALSVNKEWNTKVVSTEQGEIFCHIRDEFNSLWNDTKHTKKYEDFIEEYRIRYDTIKQQRKLAKNSAKNVVSLEQYKLEPNKMQLGFIKNLRDLLEDGEKKALLLSATGTGKTYASAFGIREAIKPSGKVLFIVHRKQILRQAMESYRRVFGDKKKMALLTGEDKNYEEIMSADFVFAMINMISKDEIIKQFARREFFCLVMDEVHHASAGMYQKVLRYFKPDFLLGMTATPDRTDGENIYELFDNNIAYEIRLQQALEYDLLCPFHYFGISDIHLDGVEINDETIERAEKGDLTLFRMLTSDERVDYIIDRARFYGYSGNRVKGLIFCSSIREARVLSDKMNERGLRTIALAGQNSDEDRVDAIDRLVSDTRKDILDYILTVNIFNEGVDIPEINQVIMLRPTESAIVFVQQLGRGLRKYEGKEFVVIIDFIGNYANNFMIPIALSGDRTYNKDNMRKYIMQGSEIIPGVSTIHFDEISKKRIFESIDASGTPLKLLKEKYFNLKYKIGRIPTIKEFFEFGEIDPIVIIQYQKGSYNSFVKRIDKDEKMPEFSSRQQATLDFVSLNLASGKRIHELLALRQLLRDGEVDMSKIRDELEDDSIPFRQEDMDSALQVLNLKFTNTQSEKKKYSEVQFFDTEYMGRQMEKKAVKLFSALTDLSDQYFWRELNDVVEYGIMRYKDYFSDADEDNLVLYQKYSRKDVCRILNWEKDDSATVYGYRIKYGTCPIFVTYEKKDDISESTKYEDQFVDNTCFSWMTRSNVRMDSSETQELIHYKENNLHIYLFIKKSDGEGADFYYCGRVTPWEWKETTIMDDRGNERPIMNFLLKLEHPVRNDIYEYFTK